MQPARPLNRAIAMCPVSNITLTRTFNTPPPSSAHAPCQVPDGICRPQRRRVPVPEAPLPVAPDTVEGQLREPLLAPVSSSEPLPASTPPASASS